MKGNGEKSIADNDVRAVMCLRRKI